MSYLTSAALKGNNIVLHNNESQVNCGQISNINNINGPVSVAANGLVNVPQREADGSTRVHQYNPNGTLNRVLW